MPSEKGKFVPRTILLLPEEDARLKKASENAEAASVSAFVRAQLSSILNPKSAVSISRSIGVAARTGKIKIG